MKDDNGQLHVIEAFIGVLLLLNTLAYIGTITVPIIRNAQTYNQLELLANDVLITADNLPNETGSGSLVAWLVMDNISALTNFFNTSLPGNTAYQLWLQDETFERKIYGSGLPIEGAVVAQRLVVLPSPPQGFAASLGPVYCLRLVVWYI